jgi:cyanophycinase-like exopeptidase
MEESIRASKLGLIVIFGSGEAAPSSKNVYTWARSQLQPPIRVSILETPAGFEPNSAQVAGRIAALMRETFGEQADQINVVPARRLGSDFSPDDFSIVAPLFQSNFILLGPGSPTYAARQLRQSLAWHVLLARHRLGAVIVLASAGAIAAGAQVLPVYEIYKAGDELHWQPGLDFLGAFGLKLAIIPHWNNADGGPDLDTSRCFVGRKRFEQLLALLPPDIVVVGIDERTALMLDIESESCQVTGEGGVSVLRGTEERRFERGQTLSIKELGPFRRINIDSGVPTEVWEQVAARQGQPVEGNPSDAALWAIVQERERLRARGDWSGADELRNHLLALGWQVADTVLGPQLKPFMDKTNDC